MLIRFAAVIVVVVVVVVFVVVIASAAMVWRLARHVTGARFTPDANPLRRALEICRDVTISIYTTTTKKTHGDSQGRAAGDD